MLDTVKEEAVPTGLTASLRNAARRPWMGAFLRVVAVFYVFGGCVHYANLLGFGELSWVDAPLSWKIADLVYAPLDTLVVVGLWLREPWGIVSLFVALVSQCVLYAGFSELFVLSAEHRDGLQSMLVFHGLTFLIFSALFIARR